MNKSLKIISVILFKVVIGFFTALLFSITVYFVSGFFNNSGYSFFRQEFTNAVNAFQYSIIPLVIISLYTMRYKMTKIYSIYEKVAFLFMLIALIVLLPLISFRSLI